MKTKCVRRVELLVFLHVRGGSDDDPEIKVVEFVRHHFPEVNSECT